MNVDAELKALRKELATVEQKIARLTSAIEAGGTLEPLIAQLRSRQDEQEGLGTHIATVEGSTLAHIDRKAASARVKTQLAVWRQVLTEAIESPAQRGSDLLREVLTGPGVHGRLERTIASARLSVSET